MRLTHEQIRRAVAEHDMYWERAPEAWNTGIPLANGHIGALIWGDGSPLKITLDKYDCWELREQEPDPELFNYQHLRELVEAGEEEQCEWDLNQAWRRPEKPYPTRVPMPRIEIDLPAADSFDARLDLYRARVTASVGETRWTARVDANRNLLLVSFAGVTDVPEPRVSLDHLDDEARQTLAAWGYEEPQTGEEPDGCRWLRLVFPAGGEYVVAWRLAEGQLAVAVLSENDSDEVLGGALALVRAANAEDAAAEHDGWWEQWWRASRVSIPDEMLESLWYAEMYKLGCSSRPGGLPITLQGLWTADGVMPPWSGDYHLDMNVQESYWPVYASNHLEAGEPLYETFSACLPRWREECRQFFGFDGIWSGCAIAFDGSRVHGYHGVEYWPGNAAWLAHHYWLHWLYSRDEAFLRQQALPMMRGAMRTYMNLLEEGDDGRLHLPLGYSPEWGEGSVQRYGPDPACDIALMRWLGESLLEATDLLGPGDDSERDRWRETLERLTDYPQGPDGLHVTAEDDLWESHRHHSHLMAIHPLATLTVEGGEEERALVERSIQHWVQMGTGNWTGWSFPWASLIASRAGLGNMAWDMLRRYRAFITPNTFHVNGDYRVFGHARARYTPMTLEAGFCAAAAIMEMLLQSWGGVIRLFPTVPDCWGEAEFEDLRAEGGFLVSAQMQQGEVRHVRIFSEVGERCVVRNPWPGQAVAVEEDAKVVAQLEGEELRWETEAGVEYTLSPVEELPRLREDTGYGWFGVRRVPGF